MLLQNLVKILLGRRFASSSDVSSACVCARVCACVLVQEVKLRCFHWGVRQLSHTGMCRLGVWGVAPPPLSSNLQESWQPCWKTFGNSIF